MVAGQPLARKLPPEHGQPGRTVTGKVIPARNGKDMPTPLGRNVHMADDGATLIADINGLVTFIAGKINVEEIFTVPGDVDLKTGNVMFLGTVIVQGNVEDGFSVKASGNIEVRGSVGKCEIIAEGDIIIHQGMAGKGGGIMQAGKNIWSKFIENATVEAGENVIVSDGLINTTIVANKKIICQGKRAAIVGGKYRACEEINAKTLGSPVGGTETTSRWATIPRARRRWTTSRPRRCRSSARRRSSTRTSRRSTRPKSSARSFPRIRKPSSRIISMRREELVAEVRGLAKEIEAIQAYLNGLKTKGRISASGRVYPGVKLVIKDVQEDVKNEQKAITFYLENQMIRTTRYEEPEDDILKKGPPDAHKTD